MADVSMVPGRTEIQLTARGRASRIPPEIRDVPGGLYPLMSSGWEVDEYRLMAGWAVAGRGCGIRVGGLADEWRLRAGWPVPVPDCDIRIECLVSAEGDILSNRDSPTALITNATMRWV